MDEINSSQNRGSDEADTSKSSSKSDENVSDDQIAHYLITKKHIN